MFILFKQIAHPCNVINDVNHKQTNIFSDEKLVAQWAMPVYLTLALTVSCRANFCVHGKK